MRRKETDYAIYNTKMGLFQIEYEEVALVRLNYIKEEIQNGLISQNGSLKRDWGKRTAFTDEVYRQLEEYFEGKRKKFEIPLRVYGTEFQKQVWAALSQIPYGETRSYKDIAQAIGNPKACRAVGMANNRNPIMIIVPCHRVIGADGSLVGYGGGLDLKIKLLKLEEEQRLR